MTTSAAATAPAVDIDLDELKKREKKLEKPNHFGEARELLEQALQVLPEGTSGYVWAQQRLAFCTYKDAQLRPEVKFTKAIEILKRIGLCQPDLTDPETLGLGGAVFKRMWEYEGNQVHLWSALALYRKGWEPNPDRGKAKKEYADPDGGKEYCGVNAAYILDLLAYLAERTERRTGVGNVESGKLREEAEHLRLEMLRKVPWTKKKGYWNLVTLAEIRFGLKHFALANRLLDQVHQEKPEPWQHETTTIQLLNLARWLNVFNCTVSGAAFVRRDEDVWACRALQALLGDRVDAALGRFRGKVGLALSGGGFRAALFHLGVLARLAEIDALRHVEVLSTVSGGSIVGAHYYLELKRLLEVKRDQDIVADDYIDIVRRVQENFLAGIQKNLRMQILSDLKNNLLMLLGDNTRSKRIGDLYESQLYSMVADSSPKPRTMPSLRVCPSGFAKAEDFKPRQENWLRKAKVPELVINTTSLNSGHNFQFTATWMGEPPGLTGTKVDMNLRHRRLYYLEDGPNEEIKSFPLGIAVAASSCVPALFEPLVIDNLYPGRSVKLVDGGVHDNQGTAGLLDEDCDFIICSDASGQMHDQATPGGSLVGVPLRSNDITMDRVRECEYDHLEAMERAGRLKGLFFIHLKKDLAQEDLAWVDAPEKRPKPQPNQTPYGIDREIQRKLAELRTDLDSFSEVEAHALMLSGYQMAEEHAQALDRKFKELGGVGTWGGFDVKAPRRDWPFLKIAAIASKPADSSDLRRMDLEKQLAVGNARLFKAWMLSPWLRIVAWILGFLVLAGVVFLVWYFWDHTIAFSVGKAVIAIVLFLLTLAVPWLGFVLKPKSAVMGKIYKVGLAAVGWIVAWIHLLVFDPIFLRRGRVERLLRLPIRQKRR